MNVQVEKLEKNMAKMTVTVPSEDFDKATVEAYNRQKNRISIPGFRKGHAPKAMIEKMYGAAIFYEEAVDIILDRTYPEACRESGLEIASRPEISVEKIEKGQDLVYTATVAVKPEVELGEYKGVEVAKADAEVTDEEVDAEIKRTQERNARIVSIEDESREIKDGDIVNIDFDGFVDGKEFAGGKGEDYPLTIGSHSFIEGFEDQLIGHKAGEEVDVNVTFPEDYHAEELKGKPALFKVKVRTIKEKQLPEIDDDFASEVSEFETLSEYKDSVRKEIKERKEKWAAQQNENNVVAAVVANAKIDVPDAMIDTEAEQMAQNFRRRIESQGMNFDQYMKYTGMTAESIKDNMKPQAETTIRTRLTLEAIVDKEGISAPDDRVQAEIDRAAKQYGMEPDAFKEAIGDQIEQLKRDLAVQEAIDFLVAEAKLTDAVKEEASEK
ncbi:MAG TPA: trigger factor [Candidatus Avilachnospira avicola]|nr:trigger factor [Candidatus Avilachnospira avicola]